ncbi:TadE/TadG family type IV pilus assembly protein [Nocardia transvalensis]|uniref:TadE/TadG family type IV pilus assembly protein n=1 Tax=Nocardia transvalensis TaxID=37333 RepID=UPI001894BD5C|nr:TadE family protein [Nocardia transvalensis]MBF6333621.1 pilus assembly protein [Nocardia transvalensis]
MTKPYAAHAMSRVRARARTAAAWARTTHDRGSHAVEFVIITPVVLLIIGVMIVAGHVYYAHQKVEHAADEGARAASIARPAIFAADPAARRAVEADMKAQGLVCTGKHIEIDTAALHFDPGIPAMVRVTVTCNIELNVLAIPGISGHRTITSTAISPADTYRERVR